MALIDSIDKLGLQHRFHAGLLWSQEFQVNSEFLLDLI